jgi:hypothetical protein
MRDASPSHPYRLIMVDARLIAMSGTLHRRNEHSDAPWL